jgi:hypothetical protein
VTRESNQEAEPAPKRRRERFHGRVERDGLCERPGCCEAGEFRAPKEGQACGDGPPDWRWFCLDHVREFNAGYSWRGDLMSEARARWDRSTAAFASNAYAHAFDDEVGAMRDRYGADVFPERAAQTGMRLSPEDHAALDAFGLDRRTTREAIRVRYKELVREYHPDMNGGDRSHEGALQTVIDAYSQLRRSPAFS